MLPTLKRAIGGLAILLSTTVAATTPTQADSNPYLGDVMPVGFGFCPRGWAPAEGQLLSIAQYDALFSLLGTTYGGDGRSSFALPDLRSRVVVGDGRAPGLRNWGWGARFGTETVTLISNNLPSHSHSVNLTPATTNLSNSPVNAMIYERNAGAIDGFTDQPNNLVAMRAGSISNTGGGQYLDIRQPTLAIHWCIALQGIYPSRN
ncbi:tail fiber protein [Maricaulis sp.]|uniref:phage tail protein n=1 Tax=Maricaulis sp. TaxID=1486257 RepID=UPI0026392C7B|nr:tail fiber protein [Maricaulis sp.]